MSRNHTSETTDEVAVQQEPAILSQGTYSAIRTPHGALVIVYRPHDTAEGDDDQRIIVPAKFMRLAERMLSGDMPMPPMLAGLVGGLS